MIEKYSMSEMILLALESNPDREMSYYEIYLFICWNNDKLLYNNIDSIKESLSELRKMNMVNYRPSTYLDFYMLTNESENEQNEHDTSL